MDTQYDVITTGDKTTLIQEYSPIYLNPNDIRIGSTARGKLNCASIPSASCISFRNVSRIKAEEDEIDIFAIEKKFSNAIENEDYDILKEMLDEYHPHTFAKSTALLSGFLDYTAYGLNVDLEKKVKFIDFLINYYSLDLNDKEAPILPLALVLICDQSENYETSEELLNDDLVFIAGYLITKGAKVNIDDSKMAQHLTTLCIPGFLLNIEKVPLISLERLIDGFQDLNKPYFQIYSEKFTVLEYVDYLHSVMITSDLCEVVKQVLIQRGANPPKHRDEISEENLNAFLKAVDENDIKTIVKFLEAGVKPGYLYKNLERPLLSMIYRNENFSAKCLEALLKAGVDPDQPVDNVSQGSIFEYFLEEEKLEHLKVLIRNGADINRTFFCDSKNIFSDSIYTISFFEYALTCGLFEIATLLAKNNASAIHNRVGHDALTMVQYVRNLIGEESDKEILRELFALEKELIKKGVREF